MPEAGGRRIAPRRRLWTWSACGVQAAGAPSAWRSYARSDRMLPSRDDGLVYSSGKIARWYGLECIPSHGSIVAQRFPFQKKDRDVVSRMPSGDTSVASPERNKMVANKLIAKKKAGDDVVAVVSAMGKTTDELVGLANALNTNPPARELDRLLSTGEQVSMTLLAMALEAQGYHAMSFTGRQAGIRTDGTHNKAKIVSVRSDRIMETVDKGIIPVIAGFQGIDDNDDMTTLGRGGSDTTAVAVAWESMQTCARIYSDVEGVFTRRSACARALRSPTRFPTTICSNSLARAPACSRCAPSSSPANGTSSSIPVRRFPTPRARISLLRPRYGGSGNHRHCARHVRGQGHDSRRSRYVGRGGEAVQRAGIQPGERRYDHPERVGSRASPTSASPARAAICRAPARPSSASCRPSTRAPTSSTRTSRR